MDNYIGEIRAFALSYAPQGWALCNGAILQISQNQALFALLGTNYGGDGVKTFALPDLQGRAPVSWDKTLKNATAYSLGAKYGTETVTLTANQIPLHNHNFMVKNGLGTKPEPGDILAGHSALMSYATSASGFKQLNSNAVVTSPTATGHQNMQPSLVINFCIATTGLYPSRP